MVYRKYNRTKAKVLLALLFWKKNQGPKKGLPLKDIHRLSTSKYGCIHTCIGRWVKWGYLSRDLGVDDRGNATFFYHILRKGERFIEDLPPSIVEELLNEISRAKESE